MDRPEKAYKELQKMLTKEIIDEETAQNLIEVYVLGEDNLTSEGKDKLLRFFCSRWKRG